MSSPSSGLEVMIELGLSYAESVVGDLHDDVEKKLKTVFKEYITEKISFHTACGKVVDLMGKEDPIVRLRDILDLPEEPLPDPEDDGDDDPSIRKKTRTWTIAEDQRLLAGIFHYGLENWQAVAQFLGSGRNRAQCSQRWTRGLNPRISKKSWTPEEDKTLESLVRIHGEKSWTKIASIMGNRSDVQCRYRYRQILNGSNSGQTSTNEDIHIPITRNGPLAMSSDNFFNKPTALPPRMPLQSIQEEDDESEKPIPLTSTRFSGSLPIFNIVQQQTSPLLPPAVPVRPGYVQAIPIAPRRNYQYHIPPIPNPGMELQPDIPPLLPHPQVTSPPMDIPPLQYGPANTSQEGDLDSFLSHFKK